MATSPSIADRVASAHTINLWPAPDMDVLGAGRRLAPAMPAHLFNNAWALIGDLAEGAGAPVDYVAISFLATAASLIGGKRRVKPYATSDWAEPCILWAAVVGDPSANKSPAIDAVTAPLRVMEAKHAEENQAALLVYETRLERAKAERSAWQDAVKDATREAVPTPNLPMEAVLPDKPERRRLMVQDATPEAVGSILAANPIGTLHLRDELAGWLMSFDRYSPGGREFWLEAYGGRPHAIDRKGNAGPLIIPFNGVSVLGGIQPEKLAASLLGTADDGLVARFLWAWPAPIPYRRPRQCADRDALALLFNRLDTVAWSVDQAGKNTATVLPLEDRAADLFEKWAAESQATDDDAGSLYKGFCGKLKGTVLRLSLAAEYIAWAASDAQAEPRSISAARVGAAIDFVEEYAKPSALRVFGDAVVPQAERNAATLARHLRAKRIRNFNARDLRRKAGLPGLRDAQAFNDAVSVLVDAAWLRDAGTRAGDTPGRRASDYLVNPAALEA